MSLPFKFKQFSVAQDRCAMKIGTDGVLLGAWVSLENNPESILDIGAGTGIISLQLAQRSTAETIDAVEIDDDAYEQCSENFEASPWGDRLFCYHASIQEFASEIEEKYDLIVSNPPFFSEDYKSDNDARDIARFNDALPFQHLVVCASHLLSEEGTFAVILPKKEEEHFIQLASENNLYLQRFCEIQGTPNSEIKRVLLEFSFKKLTPIKEALV
ncbi:MAG TPA: tRNA (adenine-N(6)-)-methyltransferase, partial [Flavobacteriaceae bacterium]|nr:tRNA (adenine-N(6)-)-methyltransferase [Flavobacteriaceae bacterium]